MHYSRWHRHGDPVVVKGKWYKLGESKESLTASLSPLVRDLAWASAIVEGEGSIVLDRGYVRINAYQKLPWVLERMQSLFGGSVYREKRGYHNWQISGARARGFLMTIYGFLSPHKKAQARRAFEK